MRHVCWMTANSNPGWRYLLMMGFTGYRPLPDRPIRLGEVSIAYEDRQLLDVRVRRLRHPENYADQPSARTRRVIGNVMLQQGENACGYRTVELHPRRDPERRATLVRRGLRIHTLLPAVRKLQDQS